MCPAARDLLLEPWIPEDVVDVDDHAEVLGLEALHEVVGLGQRHDRRALPDHHRVQRLDPEPHPVLGGDRQQPLDAAGDVLARPGQVAVDRRAADEHDHVGAQRRRLLDCPAVVVVGAAPPGRVGRREEAAAAQARDAQAGVGDHCGAALHAGLGDLVAPRRDRADAVLDAGLDDLGQRPALGRDLVEAQPLGRRPAVGRRAHATIPASASTGRIRATASSGSRSSPAASARTSSSDRWMTERALSSPPTMRKCDWWPLR
jgi:hypothetical protein